jgi:hypothetical protein
MQAAELALLRVAQVQVGEQAPHRDRQIPHPGLLDAAEPAHQAGELDARDAVGQQKVEVLVLEPIDVSDARAFMAM